MNADSATVLVMYNNKNISTDISADLISLNYKDKVSGEADELEICLADGAGLWQNSWYPQKGATIDAGIRWGGNVLNCGSFQIDEIHFAGPADQVNIKAIGSGFTQKTRTRRSYAHENKTLSEIVHSIAARIGYTVVGNLEKIKIGRSTQHRESDLHYLNKLALLYGYNFSVKGRQLIFIKQKELESRKPSLFFDKTDLSDYDFKDKTNQVFKSATIKFHHPNTGKVIESSRDATFIRQDKNYTSQLDSLEIRHKVENQEQANAQAEAILYRKISLQQTGNITCQGNVLLLSGNNIELAGLGYFSGTWHVLTAWHTVDGDGGYKCGGELKRINF